MPTMSSRQGPHQPDQETRVKTSDHRLLCLYFRCRFIGLDLSDLFALLDDLRYFLIDFGTRRSGGGRRFRLITRCFSCSICCTQRGWLIFRRTVWDVQQTAWLLVRSIVWTIADVVALAKNLDRLSFFQLSHVWFADNIVFSLERRTRCTTMFFSESDVTCE